jgi:hypothetical protein
MCTRITLSSTSKVLLENSTAIVALVGSNLFSSHLPSKFVFPTPEFPTTMTVGGEEGEGREEEGGEGGKERKEGKEGRRERGEGGKEGKEGHTLPSDVRLQIGIHSCFQ